MRIIVGLTGASGAVYGLELLRALSAIGGHEVHAVLSAWGRKVLRHECGVGDEEICWLVHTLHAEDDLGASLASGSFRCDVMAVVPCSMRTVAAVAGGLTDNLLCRAADVMLKERKPLVLAVRETPLNAVHLENMLKLARLGVAVVPASPGFYHNPRSLKDMVDMMVGRILDVMGVENELFRRWNGMPDESASR